MLDGWAAAQVGQQVQWKDYNLRFDLSNTLALQQRLTGEKEAALSCVWLPDQDWARYIRTYTAGAKHIYLREKPKPGLAKQDYVP